MTRTFQRNWLRLSRQHKHGTCYFLRYKNILKMSDIRYCLIVNKECKGTFSKYWKARVYAEDYLTPYNSVSIFRLEGTCAPVREFYWVY